MGNNSNLTCLNVPMTAVWHEPNPHDHKDVLMMNWAMRGALAKLKRQLFFCFVFHFQTRFQVKCFLPWFIEVSWKMVQMTISVTKITPPHTPSSSASKIVSNIGFHTRPSNQKKEIIPPKKKTKKKELQRVGLLQIDKELKKLKTPLNVGNVGVSLVLTQTWVCHGKPHTSENLIQKSVSRPHLWKGWMAPLYCILQNR